jgi:hypothetical protein
MQEQDGRRPEREELTAIEASSPSD